MYVIYKNFWVTHPVWHCPPILLSKSLLFLVVHSSEWHEFRASSVCLHSEFQASQGYMIMCLCCERFLNFAKCCMGFYCDNHMSFLWIKRIGFWLLNQHCSPGISSVWVLLCMDSFYGSNLFYLVMTFYVCIHKGSWYVTVFFGNVFCFIE